MSAIKVLVGKDGWLFLQNDTNRVVEQNSSTLKLTESEIEKWLRTLEARFAVLKNRGIKYYFLIAPNKESIYPEYLPDDYKISDDRVVNQLINACKPYHLPVYYPVDILQLYKSEYQLYPSGDTHWNGIGGFIAYEYVMNIINKDFKIDILDWEKIEIVEKEALLDLGNKLTPPQTSIFSWGMVKQPRAQIIYDNKAINSSHMRVTLNKNTSLPTAVIFHDSFIEIIIPFLMESFSKIHFVRTPCVDYDLIERINPDVVISEMVERFLIQPPVDF
jgi:hypothetical protein